MAGCVSTLRARVARAHERRCLDGAPLLFCAAPDLAGKGKIPRKLDGGEPANEIDSATLRAQLREENARSAGHRRGRGNRIAQAVTPAERQEALRRGSAEWHGEYAPVRPS